MDAARRSLRLANRKYAPGIRASDRDLAINK